MNSKKYILLFLFGTSLLLFNGCSTQSNNASAPATGNSTTTSTSSINYSAKMQERIKTDIDSLVKDGTLNQSQDDKIIGVLTSTSTFNRDKQQYNQNNQNSGNTPNKRVDPRVTALDKLVKDGTINQTQEDAVLKKIVRTRNKTQNNQAPTS